MADNSNSPAPGGGNDLAFLEQAVQAAVDKAEATRNGSAEAEVASEFEADESADQSADQSERKATRRSRARKVSRAFGDVFLEMGKGLRAPDPATRKMSLLFFVGILVFVSAVVFGVRRYVHVHDLKKLQGGAASEETSKNLGEFIQKQAEHAKKKFATLTLGKFTVDLKPIDGSKPLRGVLNVAELEIVLECDNKETRYFIEDNLLRARDQVTGALANLERDDLLTPEGKRRLKKKLADHLNRWLPEGKVEELFVSNQVLN